ncbi:MAG: replication protein DnaC [Actinomycetota bacterium]|jgi:DNA replication protein DnaC|nr:replication protein DnaC [Actinomycetota bacterium]
MSRHPLEELYLTEEDYRRIRTDVPSGCPTCRDTGEITVPGGIVTPCNCHLQKALLKHYLASGIPELYMRLDWPDYEGDAAALEVTRSYLEELNQYLEAGLGLLLSGSFGTGKTMLAMLLGKEIIKLGMPVYCTSYSRMIEMFAAGWRDRDDQIWFEKKVMSSKVLILDDIGKEMVTRLSNPTFDYVVRHRAGSLRPTILTTNLTEADIDERYGAGALSILWERSLRVEIQESTDDFRRAAQQRTVKEARSGWRRPII